MEERVFQKTVRNVVGRLKNWGGGYSPDPVYFTDGNDCLF